MYIFTMRRNYALCLFPKSTSPTKINGGGRSRFLRRRVLWLLEILTQKLLRSTRLPEPKRYRLCFPKNNNLRPISGYYFSIRFHLYLYISLCKNLLITHVTSLRKGNPNIVVIFTIRTRSLFSNSLFCKNTSADQF